MGEQPPARNPEKDSLRAGRKQTARGRGRRQEDLLVVYYPERMPRGWAVRGGGRAPVAEDRVHVSLGAILPRD